MSEDSTKTVWILGAGFSRSLGGPLLGDLFAPRIAERIHHAVGGGPRDAIRKTTSRTNATLTRLYGLHRLDDHDRSGTNLPWRDPEAFVAYVCAAAEAERLGRDDQRTRHVRDLLKSTGLSPAQAEKACRNYLALACWEFCAHNDDSSEDWIPYRRWAEQMRDADTVASFNYDEVCERAARPFDRQWLAAPQPEAPALNEHEGPLFLKLHGSWDWCLNPRAANGAYPYPPIRTGVGVEPLRNALTEPQDDAFSHMAAIGVPGPGKASLSEGPLGSLWNAMEERLRVADAVVFVGYSMPKSDNAAKKRILEAIRDNQSDCLSVHVVLGPPDVGGSSIPRLVGMLEWALGGRALIHRSPAEARQSMRDIGNTSGYRRALVQVHHLYAEDFLTVFERKRLAAYGTARR